MTQLSYDGLEGEKVTFSYQALPHEEGGGFSYNIRMSARHNDVIHIDTKRGTVFTDKELCALHAYWKLVRLVKRKKDDNEYD